MKVTSATAAGGAAQTRGTARASGGFSLGQTGAAAAAARAAPTQGPTGVGSIDALIALQALGDPLERRRRAVGRAGQILDVLDEVKMALIDGGAPASALQRLTSAIREQRGDTEDPRLESLLDEIETRAAVEMAKLEMLASAA